MEKKLRLDQYGKHLWTRDLARKIRSQVVDVLDELQAGDTLIIDTKGVEVFDYSFANELFGKTILTLPHEYPGRFCIVENLTKYTHENLEKALEGMGLVMIERIGRKLSLIGKMHPTDQETFAAIVQLKGAFTAVELSEKLKININAVNERLSKLTGLGLVRRQRGVSSAGRGQYEYNVLA